MISALNPYSYRAINYMHVFQPCKLNTVAEIKLMCTGLVYIKCIRHYLWIHTLNDLCSVTDLLYTHTHDPSYSHL